MWNATPLCVGHFVADNIKASVDLGRAGELFIKRNDYLARLSYLHGVAVDNLAIELLSQLDCQV
jgi:hypothetical protein